MPKGSLIKHTWILIRFLKNVSLLRAGVYTTAEDRINIHNTLIQQNKKANIDEQGHPNNYRKVCLSNLIKPTTMIPKTKI